MAEKKRVYRKNTVKGSRKGSKWPERVKTAAMCDLLVNNNLCDVARRYGVPESTLRTWLAAAQRKTPEEQKSMFQRAREEQLRALGHAASASARVSVDFIRRRLEASSRDEVIYQESRRLLDVLDGVAVDGDAPPGTALVPGADGRPLGEEDREKIEGTMQRHRPMGDFAAANYLRALTSVSGRAAELLGEDETRDVEVALSGELAELAQ